MATKVTSIRLSPATETLIAKLCKHYGIKSKGAVIAMAVAELAQAKLKK